MQSTTSRKLQLLGQLAALETSTGLLRDLAFIDARLRFPMADILAKVEGDTIAARAREIGVSRQTLYVWANEKLRPSAEQARTLEKLTGVPADVIRADITERVNEIEQAARKTRAEMAKAVKGVPPRPGRTRPKRGGMVAKRRLGGSHRKVRSRSRKRSRAAE